MLVTCLLDTKKMFYFWIINFINNNILVNHFLTPIIYKLSEDVLSVPLSPPTKLPRESSIHHKPQRQSSNHPSGNLKVLSSQPIGHQKVAQSLPPASGNLKETSNVLCDTRESSILPGDETDYKSPPSTRASSNQVKLFVYVKCLFKVKVFLIM